MSITKNKSQNVQVNLRRPWIEVLISSLVSVVWIMGWVLAKGFWSTLFAVFFPPWGWYLIVETILTHYGLM